MRNADRSGRAAPLPLALRAAWGGALLIAPGLLLRLMGGVDDGPWPRRIMQFLGARHLLQAAAERRYGRCVRQIGVGIDVVHAATDIAFGTADRRWRGPAFRDAIITTGFAALGLTNR